MRWKYKSSDHKNVLLFAVDVTGKDKKVYMEEKRFLTVFIVLCLFSTRCQSLGNPNQTSFKNKLICHTFPTL